MKLTRNTLFYVLSFVIGAGIMLGVAVLLLNIQQRKLEAEQRPLTLEVIPDDKLLDAAEWGKNFPREYERFLLTKDDTVRTAYGGSVPFSHLKDANGNPTPLVRLYAGYAFSVDYNEERGHYYALIDQKKTLRQVVVNQPGACANCHAAEAPGLIRQMGWEQFNHTPYKELSPTLMTGSTCADCHDSQTMQLTITRPALINALQAQGIDWTKATRQEMRTLVCIQCHVEYYFAGDNKVLTFPWAKGTPRGNLPTVKIEDIENYYTEINFKDWTHKETGAPMLKMQHPEAEMFSTSLHAYNGVACADCHMPYIREGAVKITDHWIRSPLTNVENACLQCHNVTKDELERRVLTAQDRTHELIGLSEGALLDAMDAIDAARTAGATDDQLKAALTLQRRAQMRWDFVSSENSTGFHNPQESARILATCLDLARQAQIEADKANPQK
jgi:nitrite reductase (cytochrome c-552)